MPCLNGACDLTESGGSVELIADQRCTRMQYKGCPFPLVRRRIVGLGGLEPPTSSLSGFCPRAYFRRIVPATCANDLPLETAGDRYEPLGSDGMWTKRGPSRATAGVHVVCVAALRG